MRGPQAVELGWRFGQNLVELRGRAGLSQTGTAERVGLGAVGPDRAGAGRAEAAVQEVLDELAERDSRAARRW
jgi:hypothetical protein